VFNASDQDEPVNRGSEGLLHPRAVVIDPQHATNFAHQSRIARAPAQKLATRYTLVFAPVTGYTRGFVG